MANDGVMSILFLMLNVVKFLNVLFSFDIFLPAAFAGFLRRDVSNTEMIGETDMIVRMPKPSVDLTASENPMPMERTNGTVTGPVVTPAESQAAQKKKRPESECFLPHLQIHTNNVPTAVIASPVTIVSTTAIAYFAKMKYTTGS